MPELAKAAESFSWNLPTDIQAETIPMILGGRDVVAVNLNLMAGFTSWQWKNWCMFIVIHTLLQNYDFLSNYPPNQKAFVLPTLQCVHEVLCQRFSSLHGVEKLPLIPEGKFVRSEL